MIRGCLKKLRGFLIFLGIDRWNRNGRYLYLDTSIYIYICISKNCSKNINSSIYRYICIDELIFFGQFLRKLYGISNIPPCWFYHFASRNFWARIWPCHRKDKAPCSRGCASRGINCVRRSAKFLSEAEKFNMPLSLSLFPPHLYPVISYLLLNE